MKPAGSLRLRLLVGVLATVAVAWIAVAAAGYFKARHELDELLDAHLAQSASILLALLGEEADEIELEHTPRLHRYERQVAFQIWDSRQRLRLHSASAPAGRLSPADTGFSTRTTEGKRWRVFSLRSTAQGVLIQVGERVEAREEVSAEIAEQLLAPLGLALPLLAGILAFAIGRGLKPLNTMAREISARDAQRMEPILTEQAPAEIIPLVNQLNALFLRIQHSLENERRFIADAAHELRTPIAAIRAQAQVARAAADEAERQLALDKVLAGCDRATRLTEQLLTLARLDATITPPPAALCDLAQAARVVLTDLGPSAYDRGVELELVARAGVRPRRRNPAAGHGTQSGGQRRPLQPRRKPSCGAAVHAEGTGPARSRRSRPRHPGSRKRTGPATVLPDRRHRSFRLRAGAVDRRPHCGLAWRPYFDERGRRRERAESGGKFSHRPLPSRCLNGAAALPEGAGSAFAGDQADFA